MITSLPTLVAAMPPSAPARSLGAGSGFGGATFGAALDQQVQVSSSAQSSQELQDAPMFKRLVNCPSPQGSKALLFLPLRLMH